MADMPAKIWARLRLGGSRHRDGSPYQSLTADSIETEGRTVDIRADLVEQMAAALRLATAQLAHYEPVAPFITAALQAYEAAQ